MTRRLLLLLFILLAGAASSRAFAVDLATMTQADIRALQQRLTDAKCYSGPLDGLASTAVNEGLKKCPVMDPILSIETGMHVAPIRRVATDRDCRIMATGSNDKTIRLWSLPDANLMRTLRGPIGFGSDGEINAVAMSPDGKLLAAGGWTRTGAHIVYLFDTATGALKSRTSAFDNVVNQLAFSADGRHFAVMLGGTSGMRIIDAAQNKEVAADRDYGASSFGATFGADNRLFTVAYDGYLRAYDQNFRLIHKVKTTTSTRPFSVAVHPNGQLLAVGIRDSVTSEIRRTSDLGLEFVTDTKGLTGKHYLSTVAWSADGERLIAGGSYSANDNEVVIWEGRGRGARSTQVVSKDTILSIQPCRSSLIIGASDPLFAILSPSGKPIQSRSSTTIDLRMLKDSFRVSRDGKRMQFGLEFGGKRPLLFDLARGTLEDSVDAADLTLPRQTGIDITDWNYSLEPKLAGKVLQLYQFERSHSLAVAPDLTQFVLGASYHLRAFDTQGTQRWKKDAPGAVWRVNISEDGKIVVAAYADGTIRWHRLSDGQELMALFVNKNDLRWVAWTPSGYYMASPGGEDMIGWHLNRGWDQAADFFPASRFRERFSRPDVVQLVLTTLDETKAIEAANKAANIRPDNSSAAAKLPPVVKILSPRDGTAVRDKDISVEYELRSPSGLPVDSVEVQIDGRPTRGFKRVDTRVDGTRIERQTVSIPPGNVQIGLVARAGTLASEVASVRVKWTGAAPSGDDVLKPKLYGVVVGVSAYRDKTLNLRYAAKDARDFAEALKLQKGGLYRDVELKVITDTDATTGEVKRALRWLEQSVTSRDVGVVFLAGHGVTDTKQRYYFLTSDSDAGQPEDTALEGVVLTDRTRSIAGKVLVFLDTCHAGQAMATRGGLYINKVVEELSSTDNGIVTYASSTGRQLSQEDESWKNGAFTKALLEGLPALGRKGKADVTNKGVITTAALDLWLAERVKELTRGAQSPVMKRPDNVPDFPLFMAEK